MSVEDIDKTALISIIRQIRGHSRPLRYIVDMAVEEICPGDYDAKRLLCASWAMTSLEKEYGLEE